jgi:type II secretion system protein J
MMMEMRKQNPGFTLLELILALAIGVMLASALFVTLSIAFKAKRTAEAAVTPGRTTSIVADLIGRDLENCVVPNATDGALAGPFEGVQQGGGNGESDAVDFYCVGSDGMDNDSPTSDGIRHVELAIDSNANPPTLVRRVWRNLLSPQDNGPDTEEILCRNVKSFALAYFDGTDWQTDWDSTVTTVPNSLPTAVQITLVLNNSADPNLPYQIERTIPISCGVVQTN